MTERSRGGCKNWLAASIPSAVSLFLGHSAMAQTKVAFRKLSGAVVTQTVSESIGTLSTQSVPVIAGVETGFEAYTEYNTQTCAGINPGDYSNPVKPTHGTLTYKIVHWTLETGDQCNDVVVPWRAAYYTWTDNGVTSGPGSPPDDPFETVWTTPDGMYNQTNDFDAQLGPRITLIGVGDVTLQNVTVAAGQQIALSISTSMQGVKSQSWGGPGTVVGGSPLAGLNCGNKNGPGQPACTLICDKANSCPDPLIKTDKTASSIQFYWIIPGSSLKVSYNYSLKNGQGGFVSTIFDVVAPTNVTVTPAYGQVSVYNLDDIGLVAGNTSTHGIEFVVNATNPPGISGSYGFQQVVHNIDAVSKAPKTSSSPPMTYSCKIVNALDNSVPFLLGAAPAGAAAYTYDGPQYPMPDGYETTSISESYLMFLSWTPTAKSGTSIPIFLGQVDWQWSGKATFEKKAKSWSLDKNSGKVSSSTSLGFSYPIWDTIATNDNFRSFCTTTSP